MLYGGTRAPALTPVCYAVGPVPLLSPFYAMRWDPRPCSHPCMLCGGTCAPDLTPVCYAVGPAPLLSPLYAMRWDLRPLQLLVGALPAVHHVGDLRRWSVRAGRGQAQPQQCAAHVPRQGGGARGGAQPRDGKT